MNINIENVKKIPCADATNGRYCLEMPDGCRLIFDDNGYVGRYDPNMIPIWLKRFEKMLYG